MPADPPPADFAVSRKDPDGSGATIYTCRDHLAHTRALMQSGAAPGVLVQVGPANVDGDGNPLAVAVHGCKGHLEEWPAGA